MGWTNDEDSAIMAAQARARREDEDRATARRLDMYRLRLRWGHEPRDADERAWREAEQRRSALRVLPDADGREPEFDPAGPPGAEFGPPAASWSHVASWGENEHDWRAKPKPIDRERGLRLYLESLLRRVENEP